MEDACISLLLVITDHSLIRGGIGATKQEAGASEVSFLKVLFSEVSTSLLYTTTVMLYAGVTTCPN